MDNFIKKIVKTKLSRAIVKSIIISVIFIVTMVEFIEMISKNYWLIIFTLVTFCTIFLIIAFNPENEKEKTR